MVRPAESGDDFPDRFRCPIASDGPRCASAHLRSPTAFLVHGGGAHLRSLFQRPSSLGVAPSPFQLFCFFASCPTPSPLVSAASRVPSSAASVQLRTKLRERLLPVVVLLKGYRWRASDPCERNLACIRFFYCRVPQLFEFIAVQYGNAERGLPAAPDAAACYAGATAREPARTSARWRATQDQRPPVPRARPFCVSPSFRGLSGRALFSSKNGLSIPEAWCVLQRPRDAGAVSNARCERSRASRPPRPPRPPFVPPQPPNCAAFSLLSSLQSCVSPLWAQIRRSPAFPAV